MLYTQTLRAANKWQYVWENLPVRDRNGRSIVWTLRELAVSGYTGTTWIEGDTFIVLNSYNAAKLPQTGQLWWPVPVLAAAGLMMLAAGYTLKKKKK